MARIIARSTSIKKLAIDRGIRPTAHGIAGAAGITYETMRKTLNGEAPSDKTMAALMEFFGTGWDELFSLEPCQSGQLASR